MKERHFASVDVRQRSKVLSEISEAQRYLTNILEHPISFEQEQILNQLSQAEKSILCAKEILNATHSGS